MVFNYTVSVEVQRTEGKFASREEIGEQIMEALTDADPQQFEGENGGTYETANWDVQEA